MQQAARVLRRCAVFAVVVGVISTLSLSLAQDANLLRDGGFEGTYSSRGRTDLNIPTDWSIWIGETPHTEDWMNLPPVAYPHNGPDPVPHGGTRSLNLNKGYATYTAAVYQQVSVASGENIQASAYAFLRTCDIPDGEQQCTSSPDSNAYTRIGIDPNGGTNPFDSDVVWSTNAAPHESWEQMTVSATATGETVTLFLYTTEQWPSEFNNVYWDDASLNIGGSGGVAASAPGAPTPQPTSAETSANDSGAEPEDDGTVIHTVVSGDTLDSIAFTYGVTRADLMALNNITDPRIIQIGQQIIVRGPDPTEPPPTEEMTAESTDEATALASAVTAEPPDNVRFAPQAPVISASSGDVVFPIDPANVSTSVCVTLFEDTNQNRLQDGNEGTLAGGSITLSLDGAVIAPVQSEVAAEATIDATADVTAEATSEATAESTEEATADAGANAGTQANPLCFDDLASGLYVVQAVAPEGYGLTTPEQLRVQVDTGARVNVAFGAAEGVEPLVAPPADEGGIVNTTAEQETDTRAPDNGLPDNIGLIVFGVAGVVLVAGMGITLLMRRR